MAKRFDFSGIDAQETDSRSTQKSSTPMGGAASRVLDTSVFKDVEMVKFEKDKTYVIKFIPYEVDKSHPKVMQGKMRAGQGAYVLDYTQHTVGANKTTVVCPKGTYGKPCPICDRYFDLKQDDPKSEEAKALKSSRRVMYNIVVLKSDDSKCKADPETVKILQASQWLFESPLLDELKKGDDDDNQYHMSDLCVGSDGQNKALKIMTTEEKVADFSCLKYQFKIIDNKWELDEDALIDQAIPLHKALIQIDKKELEELLYGVDVSGDDSSSDFDEDDIPVVKKKAVEEDDEEEEDPKAKGKCPYKYKFGSDTGMYDECDDCDCYKECRAEKRALKEAQED